MRLPAFALLALAVAARAQTPQLSLDGDHTGDAFGAALAATDDVNGDGVPDLLVGAPAAPDTPSAPGFARLQSGKDGSGLMRYVAHTGADAFGAAVAAAGDVDGDGLRDVLVGNPGAAGPQSGTEARLFSSHDGHLLAVLPSLTLVDSWDAFGHAVAGLGDLTGDGVPDFGVGGPSLSGEQPGFVRLYDGATAAPINVLVGDDFGDQFGFALASAGDVNLDGTPDILVGAPGGEFVRVLSGTDGTLLKTMPGTGGGFGHAVCAAGDVDGDGTPDVAVGIPLFNRVDVLSGKTGGLLRHFEKLAGEFGSAVAPLGDVNGDGAPDLLVGAPGDKILALVNAGAAYPVSGATGQNLFKFTGDVAGARLGTAVAAADLDGDGRSECLLGAPGDTAQAGAGVGAAHVYAGNLPGSIVGYGLGCPGSFLITPRLDLFGDPLAGGALTLSVTKALGGAPAILALGGGPDVLPLANGCILWMSPLVTSVGFVLDGGFPGAGTKIFTGKIPGDVPTGISFALQVLISDPGTDGGISGTSAFVVTVQ